MIDPDLSETARFIYEMGHLKQSKRTGWLLAGIENAETVAEHSFRTAIIGYLLAQLEGADPSKTALLCIFHDAPEARTGDIPSVGKRYLKQRSSAEVSSEQVAGLPKSLGQGIIGLVEEYARQSTPEARIARDADKLECLVQAREYMDRGFVQAESWIQGSAAALTSRSARALAQACMQVSPAAWWKHFVENYHTVRPSDDESTDDKRTTSTG